MVFLSVNFIGYVGERQLSKAISFE